MTETAPEPSDAELAPAKVNLFLHVGPVGPDGYHPVASWMVFADIGDRLVAAPAPVWSFVVDGPFGAEIGPGPNLAEEAAHAFFRRAGLPPPALRLTLAKLLPVAAGLGGGSSDAGAMLRLLNRIAGRPLPRSALLEIAADLGADGPACLMAGPALGRGRGDHLEPAPSTPALAAVLVNPGRPSPTGAVYRAYDAGRVGEADMPALPPRLDTPAAVVEALASTRNDLQPPAMALEPSIAAVLARLETQPESLLARMSGSGATCFALCACDTDARSLAHRLRSTEPRWWTAPCKLGVGITKS